MRTCDFFEILDFWSVLLDEAISMFSMFLSYFFILLWGCGVSWFFLLTRKYFWCPSRLSSFSFSCVCFHSLKTKKTVKFEYVKGSYLVNLFFFLLILGCKFWGLVPYIFGSTVQILFVSIMALMVWSAMVSSKFFYKFKSASGVFFPPCPRFLLPLLSLVEAFSLVLRPLTLSLRLTMNMIAGHVVVSLFSGLGVILLFKKKIYVFLSMLFLFLYFFFEFCMCMVQALVFSLLCGQYLGEHKS